MTITAPSVTATDYTLSFDGLNDYVTFGPAPGLGAAAFTIETRFMQSDGGSPTSTGNGGVTAIPLVTKGKGEADGSNVDMNYFLGIRSSDNVLVADFEEGAGGATPGLNHPVAGVTPIATGVWYHAAATYDGTKWQLFLNGNLETELVVGQPPRADSIQHAGLGTAMNSVGARSGYFAGVLDEVRIWDHARTAQEISDNRELEIVSAAGLTGRWGLDEGLGTVAGDSSGSGIDGTLNGPLYLLPPVVSLGSNWKYLDDGTDQGSAWRGTGFNDAAWASGPAEFGYGDGDESTVVSYGPDPGNRHVTTYFRKTFTVADPGIYTELTLLLKYDDGAAVYLNGAEVARTGLDARAAYDTYATGNAPEPVATQSWLVPPSLLIAGTNTIAVEMHQVNASSSDLSFDLSLTPASPSVPVPLGSNWKYLDDGTDQGTAWRGIGFDDAGWASGPAELGYGDEDEATVVGYGPDAGHKHVTTYFRKTFIVADPGIYPALELLLKYDDGAAVYLNGAEVARTGLAAGAAYNTYASGNAPDPVATQSWLVPPSLLIAGTNTIAVEMHQVNASSSDLSFDLSLTSAQLSSDTFVPLGSSWNYLDDGTDQGTAWRAIGFDDGLWASGLAELGYGDGDEATVLGYVDVDPVTGGTQKNATTYFRKTFDVTDPGDYVGIGLLLKYDDAGAVYINGNEVARTSNLPPDPAFDAYATPPAPAVENAVRTWGLPASVLVAGTNTIAVEIHQADSGSSDISFDLELQGLTSLDVTRGPYLQKAASDAVTVRWRTNAATDSRLKFGATEEVLTQEVNDAPLTTEHETRITGLTPDTTYYYSIGSSTGELASGADFKFTTPPVPGTVKPTRIWVVGDSGTADAKAAAVRNAYTTFTGARHTDVWLMLGDNAYTDGTDAEFQAAVFDMYPSVLRSTLLWPTIGNHETSQSSNPSWTGPYLDIFSLPTEGEGLPGFGLPGAGSGTERYYSFDYGDIHFICLDSMTSDRSPTGAMGTWLTNDLLTTTRKWIIAFWHHAPYSKGSHDSDTESALIGMRVNMLPILEAGGVDLVLTGHSHSYERSMLLDGHYGTSDTLTPAMKKDDGDGRETGDGAYGKDPGAHNGAVYSVCGSSGKTGGGPLNHPVMVTSLNVLGSLVLDVDGARLDAQFLDHTGTVRDHFTILKTPLVTVSVAPGTTGEDSAQAAVVTLSRTREIANPVTVDLTLEGTATAGADYQSLSLPVTIPGGSASATFNITPIRDELAEGTESVIATAREGTDYRVHRDSNTVDVPIQDSARGAWRFLHFGVDANNLAIAGDTADPDADGLYNLLERAFGLDPLLGSGAGLPEIVPSNDLTLSFPRPAGTEDLLYTVQVTPDLLNWHDGSSYHGTTSVPSNAYTTEVSRTGSDPETIVVRANEPISGGEKGFMRVKVERPDAQ